MWLRIIESKGKKSNVQMLKNKSLFIFGSILLIFIFSVSIITVIWPRSSENFFELGLLGKDKKAEGYFDSNNSTITIDKPMIWNIYLSNNMGNDQGVIIKMKLLNSSAQMPNDRSHVPSPIRSYYEIPVVLSEDESRIIPFIWTVSKVQYQDGFEHIEGLTINDKTVNVDVMSSDSSFRIVFELWVYNESTGEYVFSWNSGKELYSASVFMWFKMDSSLK